MSIFVLLSRLIPYRACRQCKQESKQKYFVSTPSKRKQGSSYSRVDGQEREIILEMRADGLTTRSIAEEMGRSTKTINKILQEHGVNQSQSSGGRVHSASESRNSSSWLDNIKETFHEKIGPVIEEQAESLLERQPGLMKDLIYKTLDLRPPKISLDDAIKAEILDTPEFRRRFANNYLEEIQRDGRTEMDILAEGFALVFSVADQFQKGEWARVAQTLVGSGELRQTIVEAVAAIHGNKPPVASGSQVDQKKAQEVKTPGPRNPSISSIVADVLSRTSEGSGPGLSPPSGNGAAPSSNGADPAKGPYNN
jgi:hypothetical protein